MRTIPFWIALITVLLSTPSVEANPVGDVKVQVVICEELHELCEMTCDALKLLWGSENVFEWLWECAPDGGSGSG